MNELFEAYRSGAKKWKEVTLSELPVFILYLLSIVLIYGMKLILYLLGYLFNIIPDILIVGVIFTYTESYPISIFTILLTNKIIDFVLKEAKIEKCNNIYTVKLVIILLFLLTTSKSI